MANFGGARSLLAWARALKLFETKAAAHRPPLQKYKSSLSLKRRRGAAATPKFLMAALCLQVGIPNSGTAPTLAESLVRKLETGHYLIIVDEANHLDIEAMELLRYVYDRGHLGVILIGTLRLYQIFTDGSRPAGELEQLWSRVGICELLPGLTEYEARQMIQKTLGRLPELTVKQILGQAGNSIRRLTKLFDHLKGLHELNHDRGIEELMAVARDTLPVRTVKPTGTQFPTRCRLGPGLQGCYQVGGLWRAAKSARRVACSASNSFCGTFK